jgi:hypothetical protein
VVEVQGKMDMAMKQIQGLLKTKGTPCAFGTRGTQADRLWLLGMNV